MDFIFYYNICCNVYILASMDPIIVLRTIKISDIKLALISILFLLGLKSL